MAGSELVEQYRGLVEQYDVLRQRIAKAEEQRGRFKQNVIEKVLEDYQHQREALEAQLAPLEDQMFALVATLEDQQGQANAAKSRLDETRDEIELRNIIGEFADGEYDARSAELATELEDVLARLTSLKEELDHHNELLNRAGASERREVRLAAGPTPPVSESMVVAPVEEVEVVASVPPPVVVTHAPVVEAPAAPIEVYEPLPTVAPVVPPPPADAWSATAVLDNPPAPAANGAYLSGQASGNAIPDARVSFPGTSANSVPADTFSMMDDFNLGGQGLDGELPPLPAPSVDDLGGLSDIDKPWPPFQDDFGAGGGFLDTAGPAPMTGSDLGNLTFNSPDSDLPPLGMAQSSVGARSYLIKHYGRPDAEPYELVEQVTSIGRGRDNQIQIKDDTKVSRYHCRVLRDTDGFYYVEDNNSSNGTLVNGANVTRQRVVGGEEVTIGETVFRFVVS